MNICKDLAAMCALISWAVVLWVSIDMFTIKGEVDRDYDDIAATLEATPTFFDAVLVEYNALSNADKMTYCNIENILVKSVDIVSKLNATAITLTIMCVLSCFSTFWFIRSNIASHLEQKKHEGNDEGYEKIFDNLFLTHVWYFTSYSVIAALMVPYWKFSYQRDGIVCVDRVSDFAADGTLMDITTAVDLTDKGAFWKCIGDDRGSLSMLIMNAFWFVYFGIWSVLQVYSASNSFNEEMGDKKHWTDILYYIIFAINPFALHLPLFGMLYFYYVPWLNCYNSAKAIWTLLCFIAGISYIVLLCCGCGLALVFGEDFPQKTSYAEQTDDNIHNNHLLMDKLEQ